MNNQIIAINVLLTIFLLGCAEVGVYVEEEKGGKYVKQLETKDCIDIPEILLICYQAKVVPKKRFSGTDP